MKQQFYEVKYPCRNCIYFKVCGDNMRTESCKGRKTKSELKKENKKLKKLNKNYKGEFYYVKRIWNLPYEQRTTALDRL